MPRISAIITTYNRYEMSREAILSVVDQDYPDLEILLVDDGSTDRRIEELPGEFLSLRYFRQERSGVASARNRGIRQARGEYIAFLDSDDLWHRRKISRQVEYFERNPEIKICQTEEIWLKNGRRLNPRRHQIKCSGDIFIPSLRLCLISPSAVMLTRDIFERIGYFDENFLVCEDYELWLRVTARYKVGLIREELITKRGGRLDQLSEMYWGMDHLRVLALLKIFTLLEKGDPRRVSVSEEIVKKSILLLRGYLNHNAGDRIDECLATILHYGFQDRRNS